MESKKMLQPPAPPQSIKNEALQPNGEGKTAEAGAEDASLEGADGNAT